MGLEKIKNRITELASKLQKNLLYAPIYHDDHSKLKSLLSFYNLSNAPDDQKELIWYAKNNNKHDSLRIMFESGFDPNLRDKENRTLLYNAVEDDDYKLAKILIESGADVDSLNGKINRTPLMIAAKLQYKDIMELLLKAKANPDIFTLSNESNYAHINNDLFITDHHASLLNTHLDENNYGKNALMHARDGLIGHRIECIKMLIQYGADINAKTDSSVSFLEYINLTKDQDAIAFINFNTSVKEQSILEDFINDASQKNSDTLNF